MSSEEWHGANPLVIACQCARESIDWKKNFPDRPGCLLVVSGLGAISYADSCCNLTRGDVVIYESLPRHEFHAEKDFTYYWFHMPQPWLDGYSDFPENTGIPGVRKVHFERSAFLRIRNDLQEALLLYQNRPDRWLDPAMALIRLATARFFFRMSSLGEGPEKNSLATAARILKESGPGVDVASVAAESGMSRTVLFHRFRKEFGCTPMEYRDGCLISRAKVLLSSSELSIKEIALELHFRDVYYFSRFFRRNARQSPSEYRSSRRFSQNDRE